MANRISKADNLFRTTLSAGVSTTSLNFAFTSVTGLELPQYLVIDPEVPAKTEIVYFDGFITDLDVSTTVLANRNQEGSVGSVDHDAGAEVWASPVGQHIEDLHDRVSLHTHDGSAGGGTELDYLPLDGSRSMTGDLNMDGHDINNVGVLNAGVLEVGGLPIETSVNAVQIERLDFTMPSGTGMRVARDLLGVAAPPGWVAAHIFILIHLHLSATANSWRLNTLLDGTGTSRSAGVGGVFLDANDDFYEGGGGHGVGQIYSNAGSGTEVQGLATYYLWRTE